MPAFVKTPKDESDWARARELAKGYKGDTHFAVANKIFQDIQHRGGKANPGKLTPMEQFPLQKGKSTPHNVIPPNWQGSIDSTWTDPPSNHYERGFRKNEARSVGIGSGGDGRVVKRTRESALARRS